MGAVIISYEFILKFFKLFGLVPNKMGGRMLLSRAYAATIITALFIYWSVLLLSFWLPHGSTSNKISVISNWIQLLVNAITLSITLSYPIIASQIVPRIRDLFSHFDKKVEELGVQCHFPKGVANCRIYRVLSGHVQFVHVVLRFVCDLFFDRCLEFVVLVPYLHTLVRVLVCDVCGIMRPFTPAFSIQNLKSTVITWDKG